MPYGLVPWGTGYWGIPHPTAPPSGAFVNIVNVQPTNGSFNIARNQTFTFTIKTEFSLNPNTLYVMLDNKLVINGTTFNTTDFAISINTNIDGVSKDFTITPNYLFKDGEVLTLQISATDIYGNPSPPFWGGYIVVDTRPSLLTPIYPLDGYAEVPLDLTLHFLVNQLAAPNSGLDSTTLNVYVEGSPAVLAGIIQPSFTGEYSAINIPSNITGPFEVILDYTGRYSPNDIVTVNVDIRENGLHPFTGLGNIYDQNGVIAAQNVVVSTTTKLTNAEYDLTLAAALSTYLLPGVVIYDGYQFKDSNGSIFKIAQVGIQELIITTVANRRTGSYSFITTKFDNTLTQPVFAGYFQGVYLVDSLGDGYHINVTWHPARTTRPDYDLAYLVYYSTVRSDVFFEEPKLITLGQRLPPPETVQGADAQLYGFFAQTTLPVGFTYYFGIRATEYPHGVGLPVVPTDGYDSLAAGLKAVNFYNFAIPAIQTLTSNIAGSGVLVITVTSTMGYANAGGYIVVGTEIMRYTSLTKTTFIVAATGRGLFGTSVAPSHSIGEIVKMYYGNHDDNTVIAKGVVTWETPNDPHRTRPDLVTTDFTLEDGYNTGFEPFDFCGYHMWRPDELLSDTDNCGTYVGGEFNGERGLSLYDRMLGQEEMLLEVTGEPVILLRRLWSGERCICMTSRMDSAAVRSCALCFGTGYKGGYIQYLNPRRDDQNIMVHFAPSDEDLGMGPQSGWDQRFKPGTWTLSVPSIKDRDMIVRFGPYGERDWIYTVNAVSRGKSVFGQYARQKLSLSRIDKTDVINQFKLMK